MLFASRSEEVAGICLLVQSVPKRESPTNWLRTWRTGGVSVAGVRHQKQSARLRAARPFFLLDLDHLSDHRSLEADINAPQGRLDAGFERGFTDRRVGDQSLALPQRRPAIGRQLRADYLRQRLRNRQQAPKAAALMLTSEIFRFAVRRFSTAAVEQAGKDSSGRADLEWQDRFASVRPSKSELQKDLKRFSDAWEGRADRMYGAMASRTFL